MFYVISMCCTKHKYTKIFVIIGHLSCFVQNTSIYTYIAPVIFGHLSLVKRGGGLEVSNENSLLD